MIIHQPDIKVLVHEIEEYPVYTIDCIEDDPDDIEDHGIEVAGEILRKWRWARKLWEEAQAEMREAYNEQERQRLKR